MDAARDGSVRGAFSRHMLTRQGAVCHPSGKICGMAHRIQKWVQYTHWIVA